jgi:type II secretory pathway component PulF
MLAMSNRPGGESRSVGAAGALGLEELVALNEEIAALVRTGVPLESGLRAAGSDLPGGLGGALTILADRMSRGASLSEALEAEGARVPRIYRAVVEAGLRAGRLPAALEGLTAYVQSYLDARKTIGAALSYPLIVAILAYGVFVLMVTFVVPRFLSAFAAFRMPIPGSLHGLQRMGESLPYWAPVLPVGLLAGFLLWLRTGTSSGFHSGRVWNVLRVVPGMGRLLEQFKAANFADLLGLLVDQGVAYPEALLLAVEATGDPAAIRQGRELAAAVRRGDPPAKALADRRAFPPLLRWVLATGNEQAALARSLHALAGIYRKRAQHQAETIRVYLPIVLLVVIGLATVLALGLSLFLPFTTLLRDLAFDVT